MERVQIWSGSEIKSVETPITSASLHLDRFGKEPFVYGNNANPDLDMVVNQSKQMPVATVSKRYKLVQHYEVLFNIQEALALMGYAHEDIACDIVTSKYQERMWCKMTLPHVAEFDPGDGHPLVFQLHALNSTDRSLAFSLEMGWYRLICENGMMALHKGDMVKRRHTRSLDVKTLAKYLHDTISSIQIEKDTYTRWHSNEITAETLRIQHWVDTTMTETWGVRTSARTYHIMRTGYDGNVNIREANDEIQRLTPHRISVDSTEKVPGSKPVENMLDVAHALSYVASHQDTLQTRLEKMRDVPVLLNALAR